VLFGFLGPIRQSAVVVRLRHFATALAFKPCRAARARALSATTKSCQMIFALFPSG
jgi:hypothetical protein